MTLLDTMAASLQLPKGYIRNSAQRASHSYRSYTIPKRRGGTRLIYHPSAQLKALQLWLVRQIVSDWPVHQAAKAYRIGVNGTLENARVHATSRFLLRIDLANFFPSIDSGDIASFLHEQTQFQEEDVRLFNALVCRQGTLTIGAPSSPSVSNCLCAYLDHELAHIAAESNLAYTRYADDLFFSSRQPNLLKALPNMVQDVLNGLPYPQGLQINQDKTRHSSKRGKRRVTGLTLGSDGNVYLGRNLKRRIRALIHRVDQLNADELNRLSGELAHAKGIEPEFINSLIQKYGIQRMRQVAPFIHA